MSRDHGSTDVDAQPDPAAWIGVLDTLAHEPVYVACKQRAIEVLEPRAGGRYLEVGIGTGTDALRCATRLGVEVAGIDASRVMVEEALRRG